MLTTLKFILNHPFNKNRKSKAIINYITWQLKSRIFKPPFVHKFTENSKLFVKTGMAGATGNIYTGLHEFSDMGFLLHFLRENDLFVDIGANIGSYSMLASGEIGSKSISIEPIPGTYDLLVKNIELNNLNTLITPKNIGVGSRNGSLKFTTSLDTVNHVLSDESQNHIEVKVETLDFILKDTEPILLKIDVEGFETEVLNGATITLSKNSLSAIIIELNGSGLRYQFDENKIHDKLINLEFAPYSYDPFKRKFEKLSTYGNLNTIYIRNIDQVKDRVQNSKKIKIQDQNI